MLAVTAKAPFSESGWWFETKWDGYRAIISRGEALRIYSRRGHDLIAWYPVLKEVGDSVPKQVVLDAELVAWANGRPDFHALQQRTADHYLLMVFDCLYARGRWMLHEPLAIRLEMLHQEVQTRGMIVLTEGVRDVGERYYQAIQSADLEGVMAKRLTSAYLPGRRSPTWQKFLVLKTGWFWVAAVQRHPENGWYWHLAERRGGRAVPVGRVRAPSDWVAPMSQTGEELQEPFPVEVSYREITREGHLRHARVRQWHPSTLA